VENKNLEKESISRKLLLMVIFFVITPLALFSSVISLIALTERHISNLDQNNNLLEKPKPGLKVFAALPPNTSSINEEIISADARPEIIRKYLKERNSPLEKYAELLVQTADKYQLDFRLLTAIAQKESGLCRIIPPESHNCWGWGIHSKGTLSFDSYEEAIEAVSKGLKENYIDKGYITIEQIMKKYAHPESTTWAEGVNRYMKQME